MFKYYTKINKANPNSKTLRTSIPKEIVELLEFESGNSVEWNVDVVDDEIKIIVNKKLNLK